MIKLSNSNVFLLKEIIVIQINTEDAHKTCDAYTTNKT